MNTKSILVSLLMIGIVAIAAGAGTIAYFFDIEQSTGNTFTAGTLNLKYQLDPGTGNYGNWQDGSQDTFTLSDLKPGDSGYVRYKLQNTGTLAGYVEVSGLSATHSENVNPESEPTSDPDTGELSTMDEELFILMWFDADNEGDVDVGEKLVWAAGDTNNNGVADQYETITAKAIGTFSGFNSDSNVALSGNGDITYLRINWNIPSTVENDIQGDRVTVGITFELAQTTGQ